MALENKPRQEILKVDVPVETNLSEVIGLIRELLKSFHHKMEVKVEYEANVTRSIELRITFAVR